MSYRQAVQSSTESQPDHDNSNSQSFAQAIFHSHHPSPWQTPQPVYHHPQLQRPVYHYPQPPQPVSHHSQPPQPGYHHLQPPQPVYHYPQPPQPVFHHPQLQQPLYHYPQPLQHASHHSQPPQPGYHHLQPPQPVFHHSQPLQPPYQHPQPQQPAAHHPRPPQLAYQHPQPLQPVSHHQSHHFHLTVHKAFNTVLPPQPSPVKLNHLVGDPTSSQLPYPLNITGYIAQTPNSTIQTYSSLRTYETATPFMSRQQPVSSVQSYMSLAGPSTIEGSQPVINPTQHTTLLLPSSHNVVTPIVTQSVQSKANNSSVNLSGQASHPSSPKRIRLNSPMSSTSSHQQSSHNSQTQLELFSHTPQLSTVHAGGTPVHPQQHDLVSTTHEHSQLPANNSSPGNTGGQDESVSQIFLNFSSPTDKEALTSIAQTHQPRLLSHVPKSLHSVPSSLSSPVSLIEQNTQFCSDAPDPVQTLPPLSCTDFEQLYKSVFRVRSVWYNLGLALGVQIADLQSIQLENHHQTEACLRETLRVRLEMKSLTWMDVIKALRSSTVEYNALAAEIEEQCYQYLPSTSAATAPSNTPLKNYADYLKDKYLKMTVLPDDWPPPLDRQDHFTNLALIERKKYTELPGARKMESIEYDYAYGNVDNIVEKKKPIELKQIFDPLPGESTSQNRFTILMDGAPGVGKTTISRKICIDWAQGKLCEHQLVPILVPLRELVIGRTADHPFTIADMISTDDPELKEQIVKHMFKTSGCGVMLIFDGFDELSSHQRTQRSLFLDIMKGNKLHNCSVLVTSRTYASGPLETIARINRHVEVVGFKKKQIEECIMKNLADEDKAKELLQMLNDRMDILSLCYIPLNCRIVLYVYKQQYSLPDTLTKLYEVFILYTLKHYADKIATSFHLDDEEIRCAGDFESLPDVIIKQLDCLSELAHNGMTEDKLVFLFTELKNSKDVLSLGLINMIEAIINTGELKYYQFVHLTVQEFLAARYLASMRSNDKKLKFLTSNLYNDRFRMTLLFLSGLTQLDFLPLDKAFPGDGVFDFNKVHRRKINKSIFLFLAQLLYESRISTCTWLLPSLVSSRSLNMSGYSLSQFDCIVLAHFLSTTPQDHIWDEINLSNCNLINDRLKILLSEYHSKTQVPILSMTKGLNLARTTSYLICKNTNLKALATVLQHSQLTFLNVSGCGLNDEVITWIACNLTSLRELDIHNNRNITSEGCIKLFNHLRQNISLKKLKIYYINHDNGNDAMTRAMCDMIKDNKVMTELIIGHPLLNNIELLAEALVQNNTLEVFDIHYYSDKLKKVKDLVTKLGHGKTPKWMCSTNN